MTQSQIRGRLSPSILGKVPLPSLLCVEGRVVLHDDDQAMPLLPGSLPAPRCVAYTEISAVQGTKVTPIPTPATSQLSSTKHLASRAYSDTNGQPSWPHSPSLPNHNSTQPVLLSAEPSPGLGCPDTDGVLCPPTICIPPIISRTLACRPMAYMAVH